MTSRRGGFTRREALIGAVAAIAGAPAPAQAQTPRRGGVFRLSLSDSPHFDPHLTLSWCTRLGQEPRGGRGIVLGHGTSVDSTPRSL